MLKDTYKPRRPFGMLALGAISLAAALALSSPAWGKLELLNQPAQINPQSSHAVLLAVTRADKRLVAVGESGIILLSDDNGKTWKQASVPVSVTLTNIYFSTAKDGWAVGHGGVVLHSSDGGKSWAKQLDGRHGALLELEAAKVDAKQGVSSAQKRLANAQRLVDDGPDKPLLDVYFSDVNHGLVIGAYGLAFGTSDGGKTWQSLIGQIDNPMGKHLYKIRAVGNDLYIAGEQGTLYRSGDAGKSFAVIKTPYNGTYFDVIATGKGELLVLGLRGNAYWSGDNGTSWSKVETGLPATLTAAARMSDGSLLMVDEAGRVLKSMDGGHNFAPVKIQRPSSFTGVAQASNGAVILSGVNGITRVAVGGIGEETNK